MVTKLDAPLRRALSIDGKPYVLTITTSGFLLAEKGRRKGLEMSWASLISGDAALAMALAASVAKAPPERKTATSASAGTKEPVKTLRRVK